MFELLEVLAEKVDILSSISAPQVETMYQNKFQVETICTLATEPFVGLRATSFKIMKVAGPANHTGFKA